MLPLSAQLVRSRNSGEARAADRRILQLSVTASTSDESTEALIYNLSERGLLLETSADLRVGDSLNVELPNVGEVVAAVVWSRDAFFGCEFDSAISKAVVSAALLRSPAKLPELTVGEAIPKIEEYPSLWVETISWAGSTTDPHRPPVPTGLLLVSLIIALLTASLFVLALLIAPFSTS